MSEPVIKALEQALSEEVKLLAHITTNISPETSVESPIIHEKRVEQELSQYALYAKKRCVEGFFSCFDAVKELANTDLQINLGTLEQNVQFAFSRFDSVAGMYSLSIQAQQSKACWKDVLGLTDTTLQLLYRGAKQLGERGHHQAAEGAFFFLTTVDFRQYPFWLGLGHAAFHLGNINQAINAYEMAGSCEPHAFWPHVFSANCFEALNDFQEALIALEKALENFRQGSEPDNQFDLALQERIRKAKMRS